MHYKSYEAVVLLSLLLFPLSAFTIAPIAHELFHIAVLNFYDCGYWMDYTFDITHGIYATIYPFCELNAGQTAILLLSGTVGTLLTGFLLILLSGLLLKRKHFVLSTILAPVTVGFLFSSAVQFFTKVSDLSIVKSGDIENALRILNIDCSPLIFSIAGVFLILMSIAYFWGNLKYSSEIEMLEELGGKQVMLTAEKEHIRKL